MTAKAAALNSSSGREDDVLPTAIDLLDDQIRLWDRFTSELVQVCTGPSAPNLKREDVFQVLGFLARVYNAKEMAEGLTILARARKENPAHAVARAAIEGLINSVHCLIVPDDEHVAESEFLAARVQQALRQNNLLRGPGKTKEEGLKVPAKLERIRISLPPDVHTTAARTKPTVESSSSSSAASPSPSTRCCAASSTPSRTSSP